MINKTVAEMGERALRDELPHRGNVWMDPLFGVIPMPIVWNLVAVFLVGLIFWWLLRGTNKGQEGPKETLKRRYVLGKIDRKTYLQMKEDIAD